MMLTQTILHELKKLGQLHLAEKLDSLSECEKQSFLNDLSFDFLHLQKQLLKETPSSFDFYPPAVNAHPADKVWEPQGICLLQQRQCAALILAGGQASRLGSLMPKALTKITHDEKTLLQLHLEKIHAASTLYHTVIPCVITTSQAHYPIILNYLQKHHFFGLDPQSITLIPQEEAPLCNEAKNWFLRENGLIAKAPDGNGSCFSLLHRHKILQKFIQQGIKVMTVTPIDNPLADPVDPILLGYQGHHQKQVTLKVIERKDPLEKMGVVIMKDQKIQVQEYCELSPKATSYAYFAYTGLFAISLEFAMQSALIALPWHIAYKKDALSHQMVFKFEKFIFDILPYSHQTDLLLYPRKAIYAPLKNKEGDHSLEAVQKALKDLQHQPS